MLQVKIYNKGISAIEILIVVFIIVTALSALLGFASLSLTMSTLIKQRTQANNIAQEGIEIVRNFRDNTVWDIDGLGSLTTGISYFPQKTAETPSAWNLIEGEEKVNGFTRKIIFEKVYRDGNDNIAETGTEDPNTKKVVLNVFWKEREEDYQIELITYLTNWRQ